MRRWPALAPIPNPTVVTNAQGTTPRQCLTDAMVATINRLREHAGIRADFAKGASETRFTGTATG